MQGRHGEDRPLNVTFYGVRGSTPCSCDSNRRYGGNTSCVAIEWPGRDPIVLDLGTGLRFFGLTQPADGTFRGTALVSHLHWDHVQGIPFFTPMLGRGCATRRLRAGPGVRAAVRGGAHLHVAAVLPRRDRGAARGSSASTRSSTACSTWTAPR